MVERKSCGVRATENAAGRRAVYSAVSALWCLLAACIAQLDPRHSTLGVESAKGTFMQQRTVYRSILIDGVSIFYREAGPADKPTILLLHGLPSSSRMFEPL
jgi:hypothetical protein